jgi:4-alpha-glucanotransferase
MNVPGQAAGNWRWRVRPEMLSASAFEWLREVTTNSRRAEMPDEQVDSQNDKSVPTTLSKV